MVMFHVKPLMFIAALLLPMSAYAWNQDQSQNAVAKQHQVQHQVQNQGQRQKLVNAPTTNVTVNNPSGGGAGSGAVVAGGGQPTVNFAAPALSVPAPGASGMDCPTVGVGAGGTGPFGGGGIGPSWISPDCNARKLAELLYNMGHADTAMKVLEDQYPVVREAEKTATHTAPMSRPVQPISSDFNERSAWCNATAWRTWSRAEQARNPGCNH